VSGRYRSVVVEADGGSRGNPGNAAYGAVLKDAATGAVIAERGERIGVATNNVAEYRGLIAGLELYREHADGADLEVRMDSKLVVEQMSGRWKIKHPSMKPLALEANHLAPPGVRYTWVPRERNKHADRLANEALDGPEGVLVGRVPATEDVEVAAAHPESASPTQAAPAAPPSWQQEEPTTLVLVRHGETDHTRRRLFSGRSGADPVLNDDGRAQVRATAQWLAPLAEQSPVLLSSPMRRTRESAELLGARLGTSYVVEEGLVEAGFGEWEGLSYAETIAKDPDEFTRWLEDPSVPAGRTGDAMTAVAERVGATRERLLKAYAGRVVVAATHLTPIKLLLAEVLGTPLGALFRMEVSPASVTVLAFYPDGGEPVVRLLNGRPNLAG
jgi:broad specificity phosphatase PhoE/ribonuclease HI